MRLVFVLILFLPVRTELPFLNKLESILKPSTAPTRCTDEYSSQLSSLYQLMCNNLRSENDAIRNACVGCFQQAARAFNNQPSLTDMEICSNMYLPGSEYSSCLNLIQTTSPTPAPGGCVTGYCRFVTCIRRVNADMLISDCYTEASVDNDGVLDFERVILYKNITSCILARARCGNLNPITGQQQTNKLTTTTYNKWGKPITNVIPLYNALQVTPEGDLRIIQLPGTTKIRNYFCSGRPNLRESSWLEFSCQ